MVRAIADMPINTVRDVQLMSSSLNVITDPIEEISRASQVTDSSSSTQTHRHDTGVQLTRAQYRDRYSLVEQPFNAPLLLYVDVAIAATAIENNIKLK